MGAIEATAARRDEANSPVPKILILEMGLDPIPDAVTLANIQGWEFVFLALVTDKNIDPRLIELRTMLN